MGHSKTIAAGALSAVLAFTPAATAATVQLVPHRAVYELSARPGSGFGSSGSVRGLLTYEISDGCDGWSVNQKAGTPALSVVSSTSRITPSTRREEKLRR